MREAMFAIIKKDFRGITGNRRLFTTLMITPLILTTVLPSIFLCTIHFVPDDPDVYKRQDKNGEKYPVLWAYPLAVPSFLSKGLRMPIRDLLLT